MKFDVMLETRPEQVASHILKAKTEGADGAWVVETKHDPFLVCGAAAAAGTGLPLGTAVAVAFARNPMLLANVGHDLQEYTQGNFVLGLGTQVKPHITRRFSMPWDKPVPRLRETIQAIHAIWDTWETGTPLNFTGEYYSYSLMTPAFTPDPHGYRRTPIYVGGLGPLMTKLAGEVADGFVVHRFMTRKFLDEVTLPRLEEGMARRETPQGGKFELVFPPLFAAPKDPEDLERHINEVKRQIAFYASTPAYAPVLELHGWADLGKQLHELSRQGEWATMTSLISDEVLDEFAVVSSHECLRDDLDKRFGDVVDRAILFPTTKVDALS
jgi:probable F420-dependent oxidoreductase